MTRESKVEEQATDYSFLAGGLVYRLLNRVGLMKPDLRGAWGRVLVMVLITYVPLLALACVQGVGFGSAVKIPFFHDLSEVCRFLLVPPLLILAEFVVEPWLLQVVKHARENLIDASELEKLDKFLSSSLRWRNSNLVELALLIFTFGSVWFEAQVMPHSTVSSWRQLPLTDAPTLAWYWYANFAKPLIRFIWLRWLWRYLLWSFFLFRLSRLSLNIRPTHPDQKGGLAFIATGHARFAIIAFAFGVQSTGILADQILWYGRTLFSFKYEIAGALMFMLFIFLTPLLAFTGKLLDGKRIGLFQYGALADEYTAAFHEKWIRCERGNEPLLGTGDIQSLADLGNSYSVVREMQVCLIDKGNVMTFAAATLTPFVPLLLTVYPFDELVKNLLKAIL